MPESTESNTAELQETIDLLCAERSDLSVALAEETAKVVNAHREIAELRMENVRAREQRDESNRMARYAAAQVEKIAAENARIREAAKPFAQCQLFEDRRSLGPNCCTGCALKHAMEIEA